MHEMESDKIDWAILIVIIIGTFMAILDSSIVNVALPKMMAIFNATTDQIEWILTAYMLTLGVVMPVSGFLGDTFGYKRVYIVALGLFVLGSALCGMAWSLNSMVVSRVIQALGGGIMQPLGMAMIYRFFPRSKIGMILGFWGIAAMAAPAVGPTLGGYLVEFVNWRLIFYINIPIGIFNIFFAGIILRETALIKGKQFDYMGILTASLGLFCLLLALSDGTQNGWTSTYIISLEFIAMVCLVAFVIIELKHPEPILDLRLFKNGMFTISIIIGSLISMGMFGAIFLVPLLLQNVLGQTAMKTGLIMFPAALASGIMMPLSGRLFDKYGARWIVVAGMAVVTWTTYVMGRFDAMTPFIAMTFWLTLRGAGMGLALMPVTVAGMNTVPGPLVGKASALSNVIRQIAASFGVAIFTTIMQNRQVFHFANLAHSVSTNSTDYLHIQARLQDMATTLGLGYGQIQGLGLGFLAKAVAVRSMVNAIGDCFIVASIMCLAALLMSFLLSSGKKVPAPVSTGQPGTQAIEG